jgi:Tol biopolymer transport system component
VKVYLPHGRLVLAALFALAAAAAALSLWRREKDARAVELTPAVPLTSSRGIVCCPSFSPDGSRVAFSWNGPAQDNFDIYVKLIGSSEPLRFTQHPATDKFPAWSPDGRSIAFLREIDERHAAVMVMPSLPGPDRAVTTTEIGWPDLDYRDQGPALAWSADGRYLFTLETADASGTCGIVRVSVETGEKRRITTPPPGIAGDGSLSVSPDGRTLAFTRTVTGLVNGDIYTIPLPDGKIQRITFDERRILGHAWSEDGRDLVFPSNRGGRVELWRIGVFGARKAVRLTGAGESDDSLRTILQLYPAVSRQGHRLVYTQPSVVGPDIRSIDLAGGNRGAPARLISSTRGERSPQYSPDGTRIAIHSNRSGRGEIWVYDADGSNPVRLTSFEGGFAGSPRWSPDGRSIAFDSSSLGNWDVYTVGSQGGSPVRLTTSPSMDEVPSWSADGNWIYFASNRSGRFEVWKMRANGSSQTQVTSEGGFMALESEDGRDLYYTKTDGASALWSMPVEGGAERKVVDSVYGRNFTPAKHRIWFMQAAGSEVALRFVEPGSARPTTVSMLGRFLFHGLTVSPDERRALYSQADVVGSELMLVENFR